MVLVVEQAGTHRCVLPLVRRSRTEIATGLEDSSNLAGKPLYILHVLQHEVGNNDVDTFARKRYPSFLDQQIS